MIGAEMREFSSSWSTPEGFAAFVAALRAQAAGEHLPAGFVPCTTPWWAEDHEYLGRIAIRHGLTPRLLEVGGHVGYDVRPTARRRGHATAMLRAALPAMRNLGIMDPFDAAPERLCAGGGQPTSTAADWFGCRSMSR